MAFIGNYILFGTLLVAVPVILHLVMRQKPKQLEFPALRFLQKRKETNRRQLRIKHLLLLLLRCGAILALVFVLARPSAASAVFGNWIMSAVLGGVLLVVAGIAAAALTQSHTRKLGSGMCVVAGLLAIVLLVLVVQTLAEDPGAVVGDSEAPVAAAIILDTSPRMQYRLENKTRLERAQEMAGWLLRQLPKDSDVAVLDSRGNPPVFGVDIGAAQSVVDGLEPTSVPQPLPDLLADALDLLETSQRSRKEIYLVTDFSRGAWSSGSTAQLQSALEASPKTSLYIIDIGDEDAANFALSELRLSGQSVPKNGKLKIETSLLRTGKTGDRAVVLHLEEPDKTLPMIVDGETVVPKSETRSRQSRRVDADGSQPLEFNLNLQTPGTHHGKIEIVNVVGESGAAADNLAIDDVRYFTVEVRDAWPVLLATGPEADASFVADALAPLEFRKAGRARFRCDTTTQDKLDDHELDEFAIVCLLDPAPLSDAGWKQLTDYAKAGGAVVAMLGRNASRDAMNQPAAQQLLPAELTWQWPRRRSGASAFLAPQSYQHPILRPLFEIRTAIPWQSFPVYRHWMFQPLPKDATVVMHYSNGLPAIIERGLGKGKVVLTSTPGSDAAGDPDREPWNVLPTAEDSWPFVVVMHEMMLHLVETADSQLNYEAGQSATLIRRRQTDPDKYLLFTPHGGGLQEIQADGRDISVPFTSSIGHYRLKPGEGGYWPRGFSVNLPLDASDLKRITREELDDVIGAGRYRLARSTAEITRDVGQSRRGREFFTFLVLVLALILALEQLLSDRFYRPAGEASAGQPVAVRKQQPAA